MDDLTVTTTSVPGSRCILRGGGGLEEMITLARISFKSAKSRSLLRFALGNTQTPSITEKPEESLGKVFDCSLRDTASIRDTNQELEAWLGAVEKAGLPGKFKAWIFQHGILPRTLWPLLVYEVPISTVEGFERMVSRFLRKWLRLPRRLSSIALYGQNNKLKLPIRSLNEEFMVTHTREVLQYRESCDPKCSCNHTKARHGANLRGLQADHPSRTHSCLGGPHQEGQREGEGKVC